MQHSNKRELEEDLEQRQLSEFETTISFANVLWGKEMSSMPLLCLQDARDDPNVLAHTHLLTRGCVRGVFLSVHFQCDLRTVFQQCVCVCVWAQTHSRPGCIWKTCLNKTVRGGVLIRGPPHQTPAPSKACWVIIEAANENQRLTKAQLMTGAVLCGAASLPLQQVTRCQTNTCQTAFWEMKSCLCAGRVGAFVRLTDFSLLNIQLC